jgi:eukaryotic-like serine/threonine-protein kinase
VHGSTNGWEEINRMTRSRNIPPEVRNDASTDDAVGIEAGLSSNSPEAAMLRRCFEAALDRPEPERIPYVERELAHDPVMRDRLLELLRADEGGGLLDVGPWAGSADVSDIELSPGDRLGPYTLIRVIGEGGFAVVFLAEQTEPVKRRVAVKVIRPGMASGNVLRRFESERHALARMEHPNIARVYDAGETSPRRRQMVALPYVVMEYVEGLPITVHCEEHQLTVRERLELFTQVCEGVQHAHQKGVIHRDLKPSNVLIAMVDGRAAPKVIDFGVAKLLDDAAVPGMSLTREGVLLGTPEYMSPEQASLASDAADTRTDVYSLGVLLFEMLTGRTPHDVEGRTPPEQLRIVRDEPPSRLNEAGRAMRGDLRVIVAQALQKDPDRRYSSVAELAADVRRLLRGEPISARRPNLAYQLSCFIARNRVAVVFGMIAAMALVVGMFMAASQWTRANIEQAKQQQIIAFMEEVLGIAEPQGDERGAIGGEVLSRAVNILQNSPNLDPEAHIAALNVVVRALTIMDRRAEAITHMETILDLRESKYGPRHPESLEAIKRLATALADEGAYQRVMDRPGRGEPFLSEAIERTRDYVARVQQVHGRRSREHIFALDLLGTVLADVGEHDAALAALDEAASLVPDRSWQDGERAPFIDLHRAYVLNVAGRWDEARAEFEKHLAHYRGIHGDQHRAIHTALNNYGYTLRHFGEHEEAIRYYQAAADARLAILGSFDPGTLNTINTLGFLQHRCRRLDDAERSFRTAIRHYRQNLGEDHPLTIRTMNNLAAVLLDMGRPIDALAISAEVVRGAATFDLERQRRFVGIYYRRHATVLQALERFEDASSWLDLAYEVVTMPDVVDEGDARLIAQLQTEVMEALGRADEAAMWRERAR